jgi:hypothetical protein
MRWTAFALLGVMGIGFGAAAGWVFYVGVLEGEDIAKIVAAGAFALVLVLVAVVCIVNLVSLVGGRQEGKISIGGRHGFSWRNDSRALEETARAFDQRTAELKNSKNKSKARRKG